MAYELATTGDLYQFGTRSERRSRASRDRYVSHDKPATRLRYSIAIVYLTNGEFPV